MPNDLHRYFMMGGFLSSDLNNLVGEGMNIKFSYPPEVMASVIGWFFNNHDAQKIVIDMFWENMAENRKILEELMTEQKNG